MDWISDPNKCSSCDKEGKYENTWESFLEIKFYNICDDCNKNFCKCIYCVSVKNKIIIKRFNLSKKIFLLSNVNFLNILKKFNNNFTYSLFEDLKNHFPELTNQINKIMILL